MVRGGLLGKGLAIALVAAPALYGSAEFTPCKNSFTAEQQVSLGEKAKAQVYKQMPVLPDSSPVTRYIQQLGAKLAAQAPGHRWPYNFHVANVAEINAFALPGGSVFVNLGTIQAATSEAQLAGVMAHEISHVVLQHSVCNAEKQQRVGIIAGLGQLAAGVLLGDAAGQIAQEGIGLTAGLSFLRMSRGAEREADLEGAGIAYDAGYDPHGMAQFFEIIQSKYGAGGAQFLSDHPNPGNRTEYVDKEIAGFPPKAHLITNTPEFDKIKAEVAGMHAYTSKEVAAGGWRTQAAPAPGGAAPEVKAADQWKPFGGDGFSGEVPANWNVYGSQSSMMIGPGGGITQSSDGAATGVSYGMLTDRFQPSGGTRGAAAVDALIDQIAHDNPGFKAGTRTRITAHGTAGTSVECSNPGANGGRGEHDWVVAFPQGDGSLRYFVFVAPSPEFERWRPAFRRIAESLRLQ